MKINKNLPLICFVATKSSTVTSFLLPHIKKICEISDVIVVTNPNNDSFLNGFQHNIKIKKLKIKRQISFFADLNALINLIIFFYFTKPTVVHTITPKSGLLGMIAAWITGVPIRIHSFTGQVWVTKNNPMRTILKASDWLTAYFSTDILVDSHPQREFLIQSRIVSMEKSSVIGNGSICGVDTIRFIANSYNRKLLRERLGLLPDDFVILYLGRVNREKGVLDLAIAFRDIAKKQANLKLLVVGPDEENLCQDILYICEEVKDQLVIIEFTSEPEQYMQVADLFCLPSYREGFGSSVIEAASCSVPVVASRIYGLQDSVIEGETGWFFSAGNYKELASIIEYAHTNNAELRRRGYVSRDYVCKYYSEDFVVGEMIKYYSKKLEPIIKFQGEKK
jgi:glycosyltransferase involved in cell wall biosynthesis